MFEYKYPRPASTATVIAFRTIQATGEWVSKPPIKAVELTTIIRGNEPFKGKRSLPGGFIEVGKETLELCAGRELYEETHMLAMADNFVHVVTQSQPDRDPREHVIDHVYAARFDQDMREIARAGDDAAEIEIITISRGETVSIDSFAFDHGDSLRIFFKRFYPELNIQFTKTTLV